MIERERFEAWARQRWTHPEDFDQRIKAPSKYNNYEVQAAWEAWQERAAQPAPSDWPMLRDGHLRALCFAYEKGFAAGIDERNTENVFGESGSQAAAFDVGLDCGRIARNRAQPAPSVPDGWKLVPTEPTHKMLDAGEDTFISSLSGTPTSSPIAVYRAMIDASPEAKP